MQPSGGKTIQRPLWDLPVDADAYARAETDFYRELWAATAWRLRGLLEPLVAVGALGDRAGWEQVVCPAEAVGTPSASRPRSRPPTKAPRTVADAGRLLAESFYMANDYDGCFLICDRAETTGLLPPADFHADMLRAWVLYRRGQIATACDLARDRLQRAGAKMPPEIRASFLHLVGLYQQGCGRARLARQALTEALALARTARDIKTEGEVLMALGIVERVSFRLPEATDRLEEAFRLNHRLGLRHRQLRVMLNLMVARYKSGWPQDAVDLADSQPGLRSRSELTNRHLMVPLARAKGLLELGRIGEARQEAGPVLEKARARRYHRAVCLALEVLGDCELARGESAAARVFFQQALQEARHPAAGVDLKAGLFRRLGQADLTDGELSAATRQFREAARTGRDTGEKFEEGISLRLLGSTFRRLGQFDRAHDAVRQSVAVLRDMGARLELGRGLLEAARLQLRWWGGREADRVGEAEPGGSWSEGGQDRTRISGGQAKSTFELSPHLRGSLEMAWAHVAEASDVFGQLDWDPGRLACERLMEELRAAGGLGGRWSLGCRVTVGQTGAGREVVARSPVMLRVLELVQVAAGCTEPILLTGETGTGKDLLAWMIHGQSKRGAAGAWVPVNCAGIPESLFEREFFGHTKGAFSGADKSQAGLCEAADGGTLFLDEIGEMPPALQAKLLRLLQEGRYRRLGDPEERSVDLRVIAATNADLPGRIARGGFRQDLYFRLKVLEIDLPPLRVRTEDIEPLVELFAREAIGDGDSSVVSGAGSLFGPEVLEVFRCYRWPGNVRELEGVVRRLALLARGSRKVAVGMLPPEFANLVAGAAANGGKMRTLGAHLEMAERDRIVETLTAVKGNRTAAAQMLGISRNSLYRKMERLGIRIPA